MKRILLITFCILALTVVYSQTKKERKKYKIRSTTEWETHTEGGKTTSFKSAYEEFDRSGRNILKIEYAPDGLIIHKETAVYDQYGNKTEESEMDIAKKKNVRRTFRYNAMKDKTEEVEYNGANGIEKKTEYTYDANGNKIKETELDPTGKLVKRVLYTYNSKNLKTGKETFRNSSLQESIKKWDYVYY